MHRTSFASLTAAILLALAAAPLLAEDRYWVGSSGDWFDPANWSATPAGPGDAGVPAAGQYVYLTASDSLDRVVTYSGLADPAPKFASTRLEGTGGGLMTLEISGGQLSTSGFHVGFNGRGAVVQTGGNVRASSLNLTDNPIATGSYTLENGQLITINSSVYRSSQFTQTGGTHTTARLQISSGAYTLSAGDLISNDETQIHHGLFQQQGGTHTTAVLNLAGTGSSYQWTGGDLTVTKSWILRSSAGPVTFGFPATPRAIAINGIVDIGPHSFTNAGNVSLALGPESLLIVDDGYDPASEFGSFTNLGLTHISGTTLVIPAGRTIAATGTLTDPVKVYGSIVGSGAYLSGPLTVASGASLQSVNVFVENHTSRMDGGVLTGSITLGKNYPAVFQQTAGAFQGHIYLGGASESSAGAGEVLYDMRGGSIEARNLQFVGDLGTLPARFHQSAGVVTGDFRLTVGSKNPDAPATYEFSGGTLDVAGCTISENGVLAITDPHADIRFSNFFSVSFNGRLQAVPGAKIHIINSAWGNFSTYPELLEDLRHLTFVFEGQPCFFQAASHDLGPHISGFTNNFAHGTVQIGSDEAPAILHVLDSYDNLSEAPYPETVYVKHLILNPGSFLSLDGHTLYYYRLTDNGGTVVPYGGQLIQVPVLPGDSTGDDLVNSLDISAFVQALVTPTAYDLAYPHADHLAMNDLNGDGYVNSLDIHLFIQALMQPPAPASSPIPEPASAFGLLCCSLLCHPRRQRCPSS